MICELGQRLFFNSSACCLDCSEVDIKCYNPEHKYGKNENNKRYFSGCPKERRLHCIKFCLKLVYQIKKPHLRAEYISKGKTVPLGRMSLS